MFLESFRRLLLLIEKKLHLERFRQLILFIFICMTLPYPTGWQSFVDEVPQKMHHPQIIISEFFIFQETHTILFKYKKPGLVVDLICTLSLVLFIILFYKNLKKGNI